MSDAVFYLVIVHINGEKREIAAGLSVAQMLQELGIPPRRVVVEINRDVLSHDAHEATFLKEGDMVEIVQFVGGG
ncbi:MAG: sulfur carrier protein ThiS [Candidatus Binatia bacterium]